jgi:predicted Ser/Thr protein kinase
MPRYDAMLVELVSGTRRDVVESLKERLRLYSELTGVIVGVYKRQHNEQTPRLSVDPCTMTKQHRNAQQFLKQSGIHRKRSSRSISVAVVI